MDRAASNCSLDFFRIVMGKDIPNCLFTCYEQQKNAMPRVHKMRVIWGIRPEN
jgi:hypothetical protein